MIGLVTDSNSQLPAELRARYDVSVVPLTIVVVVYKEGVDLETGSCYDALELGVPVSTAAPSPGDVLRVYEELATRDVESIVSIHVGGTCRERSTR